VVFANDAVYVIASGPSGRVAIFFSKMWQLHRGMTSLNVLDCGAKLIARRPKTRLRLKQFGRLMLHFAKRHNVSAMIRAATSRCNCGLIEIWVL